jgi:maltose/moltooligosaccharide transporter
MPKVMWQLALVYLFQWYVLFWQNSSKVLRCLFEYNPPKDKEIIREAVGWTGLVNDLVQYSNFLTFDYLFC